MEKSKRKVKAVGPQTERGRKRYCKIIETATLLFLKKGYEATSINEIIHDAGGSLTTAYQCFKNKEGLFWAVFETIVAELKDRYITFLFEGDDYREAIKVFVTRIYENMFEPKMIRLMLVAFQIESLREKVVAVMYRELFEPLRHILIELEERFKLKFVFGIEETLLCVLRHARGTVLEFIYHPELTQENKLLGIEQTTAIFLRLIDMPKTGKNK